MSLLIVNATQTTSSVDSIGWCCDYKSQWAHHAGAVITARINTIISLFAPVIVIVILA